MLDKDVLKQIEFIKVLEPDYFYLKEKSISELVEIREIWLKEYNHLEINEDRFRSRKFFLLQSLFRPDYNQMVDLIKSDCLKSDVFISRRFKGKKDYILSQNLYLFTKYIYLFKKVPFTESGLIRQCLYIRLCGYLKILECINKCSFECFIAFADMQPVENLATQYFKLLKVPTVTLQHGLFVEYPKGSNVNVVNYKNHVAEYFLSWGECTKELIERYHPHSKVTVVGKPEVFTGADVNSCEVEYDILVILDQRIFEEQNFKMINVVLKFARVLSLSVAFRFHPQLNKEKYFSAFNTLNEASSVSSDRLIVGHTSSLLYEYLRLGYKVLRYASNAPAINYPHELEFTDESSISLGFEYVQTLNRDTRCQLGTRYIDVLSNESLSRYAYFFQNLTRI